MFRCPLYIQLITVIHIDISPGQICIPRHQIHPVTVRFLLKCKEHILINIVLRIHHLQIQPDICHVVHVQKCFRFRLKRFIVGLTHLRKSSEALPVSSCPLTIPAFQFHSKYCQILRWFNRIYRLRQKLPSIRPFIEIFLIGKFQLLRVHRLKYTVQPTVLSIDNQFCITHICAKPGIIWGIIRPHLFPDLRIQTIPDLGSVTVNGIKNPGI